MGGKTPAKTTQESTYKMSPEQQKVFDLAFPSIQQYASTPLQMFQGTGIAGFTPLEQQGQAAYTAAAPGVQAQAQQAQTSNNQLMDPSFMLDVNNNQYLRNAIESMGAGLTTNLMENIMPGVRAGATQAGGMYSGASTKSGIAEGKAIGATQSAIADNAAKMMLSTYQQGLQGMGSAIDRNQNVMAQQLMPGDILSTVGAQQRGLEQAQLDESIRNFYTAQGLPFMRAQELMSMIMGMPGGTASSTVTGALPQQNPIMGGIGGAMSGAALGSMLFPGVGTAAGAGIGALASLLGR